MPSVRKMPDMWTYISSGTAVRPYFIIHTINYYTLLYYFDCLIFMNACDMDGPEPSFIVFLIKTKDRVIFTYTI